MEKLHLYRIVKGSKGFYYPQRLFSKKKRNWFGKVRVEKFWEFIGYLSPYGYYGVFQSKDLKQVVDFIHYYMNDHIDEDCQDNNNQVYELPRYVYVYNKDF